MASKKLPGEAWAPHKLNKTSTDDFHWITSEEVHRSRRKAILEAHPEVKTLMGREPLTILLVIAVTLTQITVAYLLRNTPVLSFKFLFVAYAVGGTLNQNAFLSIHDITHNLAFRGVGPNRLFAMFANLPIGVPFAMLFKRYHSEHHRFFGEDGMDTDLPSKLELVVLHSTAGKLFFVTFQIFFYALRPGLVRHLPPTRWLALNILVQLTFDWLVVTHWGWHAMLYFLISSHMAGSLHPLAGHFIGEHFLFDGLDQETWSYYGPLNILVYNAGYHNEHHDFPAVPWTKLPALRAMAHEFYDPLPSHPSWPGVIYRFVTEPQMGLWSRAKRRDKGTRRGGDGGGLGDLGGLADD